MAKKNKTLPSAKETEMMVDVNQHITSDGDVWYTTKHGTFIAGHAPNYHEWIRFTGDGFERVKDKKEELKDYLKEKLLR